MKENENDFRKQSALEIKALKKFTHSLHKLDIHGKNSSHL